MGFTKITQKELNSRGATTLPNQPTMSATALKEEFDAPAKQIIAPKFNKLIDDLGEENASSNVGGVAPTGQEGSSMQEIFNSICRYVSDDDIADMFKDAPTIPPFATGTDAEIAEVINAYYDGTLTLSDIRSAWSIGDTRDIEVQANGGSSGIESHRTQTVTIQILDFDHDVLTTPVSGKLRALLTVDLKNCLRDATVAEGDGIDNTENGHMNQSNTNTPGWSSCERRTWCNSAAGINFHEALPTYIKTLLKPVDKLTSAGDESTTIVTTSDKVFLLSEVEVTGTQIKSAEGEGTQYALYAASTSNRTKLPKWNNFAPGASSFWWLRSPDINNDIYYCSIDNYGAPDHSIASDEYGIAPAFCM